MIQRWQGLFISPPLPWITASPCQRLSKTLRLARPCRRYCHRRMDFSFSTRRSSPPHSPPTWMLKRQHSWLILKSRGVSTHLVARKTKPSWYLIATEDKMIPPPAQHFMAKRAGWTVVEVAGSHAIYVSQPNAVAKLIVNAAKGAKLTA